MTCVRLSVGGERKPEVLKVGLARKPLLLFRHRRGIRREKRQSIEGVTGYEIIQLSHLRLLDGLPCFAEALQGEQAVGNVFVRAHIIRGEAEAFAAGLRALLVLPL